jgi:hypothetical protein
MCVSASLPAATGVGRAHFCRRKARRSIIASLFSAAAIFLFPYSQIEAHTTIGKLTAHEITLGIKGKICTTSAGARFSFERDGQYSYEGLWKNAGRYAISDGAITILLDSGLERSFVISRKKEIFYMEKTAISCE